MNRRKFLSSLAQTAAAIAAAPLVQLAPKPVLSAEVLAFQTVYRDVYDAVRVHERYIVPAAQALADSIDLQIFNSMQIQHRLACRMWSE